MPRRTARAPGRSEAMREPADAPPGDSDTTVGCTPALPADHAPGKWSLASSFPARSPGRSPRPGRWISNIDNLSIFDIQLSSRQLATPARDGHVPGTHPRGYRVRRHGQATQPAGPLEDWDFVVAGGCWFTPVPVNAWAGTRRVRMGRHRAGWGAMADIDERFAVYVRDRGEHHLRVAVLLTGDWHAAEDLVQTSLVKLYQAWPKLQLDRDPDAYLRRIMVNTHRSWWRARWRRETPTGELPETVIADFADGQALAAQVRQALQALPRRQGEVLVLRYCADLPEAQVADLLGCSLGAVKTHARRGLQALRQILREDHLERHGS